MGIGGLERKKSFISRRDTGRNFNRFKARASPAHENVLHALENAGGG